MATAVVRILLPVTVCLAAIVTCGSVRGVADADDEAVLLTLINHTREAQRLRPLARAADLDDYARAHSRKLASRQALFHSTRDQLRDLMRAATSVAENVAFGPEVRELHQQLLRSRGHRRNILGNFNEVGLAIERGADGYLYVTEVFRRTVTGSP